MARVTVFDTTLRDGEQSPGASMTPAEKLRLARQLDALGVDVIEAGFPVSSPDDFAGVQGIAREVRRPVIAGLARATAQDIDRAAEAVEPAARPRIHTFIATSEIHLRRKLGIDRDECVERAVTAVERARRYVDDVEFSAEDATRTDIPFLCRIYQAVIEAGATTINVPDTVGYALPDEMRRIMQALFASVVGIEDVTVSVHCHDDLGLAVANTLAAVDAGARQVECTINGIGERAGNASLEEIVMAMHVRAAAIDHTTGIDARQIYPASRMLTRITGIHPQPNKAVVGRNAFAHEAGIHQDGMIKERTTYEIMTAETVGAPGTSLVLGKHSGRRALRERYKALGHTVEGDALDRAYRLFKMLADQKKEVLDEDLLAILHHGTWDDVEDVYRLVTLDVRCGGRWSTARVQLDGEYGPGRVAEARGDGPIAAALAAVNELLEHTVELEDFQIRAATPGRDAVGEVHVRASVDGRVFTGRGASTDVVDASVRAYLHAINKAEHATRLEAKALEQEAYLWGV
jgi:2-isopropylmalate synthase